MTDRFRPLVLGAAIAAALTLAIPAVAQAPSIEPPTLDTPTPVEPPKELPPVQRGDPTQNLDRLFAALRAAPTDDSAKFIEGRIWALWTAAGGDTATVLMGRARAALELKDFDLAIKLLTAIIDIKPDYVEAWNRRATIYFMQRDFGAAMSDLRGVLAREPRHFGAWAGLGMILQGIGDEKLALAAFRRALELHPRLERIPDLVKKLTESVEGREI
jgi:tetratricopeptide (TPR) repeat protein